VKAGEQEQLGERAGVDQRKREGRDPTGERREQAGGSGRMSLQAGRSFLCGMFSSLYYIQS